MNNIETMRLALEAMETNNKAWKSLADSGDAGWWEAEEQPFYEVSVKAITALRQAIEQAQQAEPCGLECDCTDVCKQENYIPCCTDQTCPKCKAAIPPPRQWVGLTPQERDEINEQVYGTVPHHVAFHAAIEARLKAKNT